MTYITYHLMFVVIDRYTASAYLIALKGLKQP
jgi:hypothetical protein